MDLDTKHLFTESDSINGAILDIDTPCSQKAITSVIIATTMDGGHMATCTIVVEDITGIDKNYSTKEVQEVVDINGKASSLDSKGIKIIRYKDGTTIKTIIR